MAISRSLRALAGVIFSDSIHSALIQRLDHSDRIGTKQINGDLIPHSQASFCNAGGADTNRVPIKMA